MNRKEKLELKIDILEDLLAYCFQFSIASMSEELNKGLVQDMLNSYCEQLEELEKDESSN